MLRLTRVLRNAAKTSESILIKAGEGNPVGITGIYQHPNPRPALLAVYDATLKELANSYPSHSVYRQSVENLTKHRRAIVDREQTTEAIEQAIGSGLIEEVLIQAGEELELAKKLAVEKPWEELMEQPVEGQWKAFERETS